MPITEISTDRAPRSKSPLSQAIRFGDLLFVSGQVAADPESGQPVEGGIREQTERVLENLNAVLEAGGSSLEDVLKTTCFLTDMADFAAFNELYSRYFPGRRPARSTVGVAGLAGTYIVEVEAVAVIREAGR
jgi:2-iminobutanoate/2-iminopropanoate deaminase